MIPIIFERNETAFNNNGIGRLRDCLSCEVTEERNGVFECDFTYPIDGANFEQIQFGRFIGVTHDEAGDVQPFEIVGQTRPINGLVTFHAVHLSYRQSQMVATGANINSLSAAFALLETAQPSNPFSYETDIESTAYMAAADGTPRTVRQMLGGVQGSILDAYGGEFEWDKWNVILHRSRGENRDFAIRYGVNLLDYNEDTSYQGTFTSCVAYWRGSDGTTITTQASLNEEGYNGNDICVPLDLTDKFEEQPTAEALQTEAIAYMRNNQTNLPAQTINVDFVRLSDMGEFSAFQDLLKCNLCDTVKVIFPMYNVSASFKIVKTVWDVLGGRYSAMELGTLSTTLAEALGITQTPNTSNSIIDGIIEEGTSGIWEYKKYANGEAECVGTFTQAVNGWTLWANNIYYATFSSHKTAYPTGLFIEAPRVWPSINSIIECWPHLGGVGTKDETPNIYADRPNRYTGTATTISIVIQAKGRWK